MKIPRPPHAWAVTPKEAVSIQKRLAARVVRRGRIRRLSLVAGVDLAFRLDPEQCIAGVVVWDVAARHVVESHTVCRKTRFPYVPGLLSFREAPAILSVLRKLRTDPDVFMFDGQGFAHPRRFGLACHVGVLIDRPTLGCAKSILVGTGSAPGERRGSVSPLACGDVCVGMAVRTRSRIKPVYISVGHRLSLAAAVEIALVTGNGFRLPEPTRLADKLVALAKRDR